MLICKKCNQKLTENQFYKNNDKYYKLCKKCFISQQKKINNKNRIETKQIRPAKSKKELQAIKNRINDSGYMDSMIVHMANDIVNRL